MHNNVILLASGPSVQSYNLRDIEQRGNLIALNGAALYVKPAAALTMDRLVAEYCCPLWKTQGVPSVWIRKGITQNFDPATLNRYMQFEHDGTDPLRMTPVHGRLNGSNSGTCALNLAYQIEPGRIFLLGYDMQRSDKPANLPYWHPPYSWNMSGAAKNGKLAEWAREFDSIAEQFKKAKIEVYNVNHRSLIESFPRISYKEFLRMTDGD